MRKFLTIRDSGDECVAKAGVREKTGRIWNASSEAENAEGRLQHKAIIGSVAVGKQGLGHSSSPQWFNASTKEKHSLIQQEVRASEEAKRVVKSASMKQQGAWLNWDGTQDRKLSWPELWSYNRNSIKFLLQSVYDILPSPVNLSIWGIKENPSCVLCGKFANLEHILSSCATALTEGRYTWRHDRVLEQVAIAVDSQVMSVNDLVPVCGIQTIKFVKSGAKPQQNLRQQTGILRRSNDWKTVVDLGGRSRFPQHICDTNLRPDIVIWSNRLKQVILVELTVPWETRIQESHERKKFKYDDLVHQCIENGWTATCEPIEVGARGFMGQSVWHCLKLLGFSSRERKRVLKDVSRKAEQTSRWIWLRRESVWQR